MTGTPAIRAQKVLDRITNRMSNGRPWTVEELRVELNIPSADVVQTHTDMLVDRHEVILVGSRMDKTRPQMYQLKAAIPTGTNPFEWWNYRPWTPS